MMDTREIVPLVVAFILGVILPVALLVRLGVAIFSEAGRLRIKQHPFIHVLWLVVAVIGVFVIFVVPHLMVRDMERRQAMERIRNQNQKSSNQQIQPIAGKPGSG